MGSKHVYYSICAFILLFLAVVEDSNAASCTRISKTQATDEYGSYGVWGGAYDANNGPLNLPSTINITDENFQPNGTLLASSVVDFVQYGQKSGYDPEQILFSCTADSAGQLYEIYATNGDNAYGGLYEDGATYGLEHSYATYQKNLVVRITNNETGQYFKKNWQYRALTNLDTDASGNILVKAKNFTSVTIELYRIGDVRGAITPGAYGYSQPAGYIAFGGPGISYPADGADSQTSYPGWYAYWPGNISLYKNTNIRRSKACRFNSVTPNVLFPTISTEEINNGGSRTANIDITYQCQSGYTAGVSAGQNAVGFQVSSGSYSAALAEGLTTTGSGLTYLLSNQYGVDSNVATGVGIRLEREGTTLNWLSDANVMTGGNADGWYKLNGTQVATDDVADSYQESFSAILEALPGQTATPGKVYAQAQVFIRVQ